MSIKSVIAHTINNILVGDMYLSVRNAEGQEKIQIYPTRFENIYKHEMKRTYLADDIFDFDDIEDEMYFDEEISCETRIYCRFRMNGKLTHAMQLRTLTSFISKTTAATIHFMPYNIEVDAGVEIWSNKFDKSLSYFIQHTFTDLPTTCVHENEQMKLTKETLNAYKRKRDKVLGL